MQSTRGGLAQAAVSARSGSRPITSATSGAPSRSRREGCGQASAEVSNVWRMLRSATDGAAGRGHQPFGLGRVGRHVGRGFDESMVSCAVGAGGCDPHTRPRGGVLSASDHKAYTLPTGFRREALRTERRIRVNAVRFPNRQHRLGEEVKRFSHDHPGPSGLERTG